MIRRRPEVVTAYLRLAQRLEDMTEQGKRTPCQVDPAPFVSDDHDDRHAASLSCLGCPVLAPCLVYAETAEEPHHVWGGRDRAPDRRKTPRKEMAS
jgi:hypothetical protein